MEYRKYSLSFSKCFVCLFLLLNCVDTRAQLPKLLKDASETFKNGAEAIKSLGGLIDATKRTSAEFNKSVKVVKDNSFQSSVSESQQTKPKFKKGVFTNFKWEPVAYFENQLFPSVIISMATYKGEVDDPMMNSIKSSSLGFRFNSDKSFIPVRWEIESVDKQYFDKVSGDFMFQQARQEIYFMPSVPWNVSTLAKQLSSTPINVVFRIFDSDGNKEEKSVPLFMRSINDCLFSYKDKKLDFLFTSYIQEQHPEVDKILKEALNTKMITSVSGYQGDELNTLHQVAAVWKVLHDRGFQYSSTTETSTNSTIDFQSQQVRTFDNALKTQQANCVDGTVVFASILRAMGISTLMVLTHDHCFLGFYTSNRKDRKRLYLETTMLSSSDIIDKAKTPSEKKNAYFNQFLYALNYATKKEYPEYKAANDLIEVDVNYYRNFVRPLPF